MIGKRRAGADEIAVAIAVFDAVDRRPVFVGGRARREATFAARIGAAPLLVRRVVDRMRSMAQRALLHRPAALLDCAALRPDPAHRCAEAVALNHTPGSGLPYHTGPRPRKTHRLRMAPLSTQPY